jgi:HD-GYP domain-containing protein (c-di-GMP phosphodiesterase class II)
MLFEDLPQPLDLASLVPSYAPEELATASASWAKIDAKSFLRSVVEFVDRHHMGGDIKHVKTFNFVSLFLLHLPITADPTQADAIAKACFYYYFIGDNKTGLILGRRALSVFNEKSHTDAMRKFHNVLSVISTDTADNVSALSHSEQALRIAKLQKSKICEASVISNSLIILGNMGLYQDAIRVALGLLATDGSEPHWRSLHGAAATNALKWSWRLRDDALARRLIEEYEPLVSSSDIHESTHAYFELYRVEFLIDSFDYDGALKVANVASLGRLGQSINERVKCLVALTRCQADYAGSGNEAARRKAVESLKHIHKTTRRTHKNHADVLRALVRVHANPLDAEMAKDGITYVRELLDFQVKHTKAQFFHQMKQYGEDIDAAAGLARAWGSAKSSLDASAAGNDAGELNNHQGMGLAFNDEMMAVHHTMARMRVTAVKREMKTEDFETAENWAVTAELIEDPSGEHCFRVGYLARLLAVEIGLDGNTAENIGRASRLHDIGKIAVNEVTRSKPWDLSMSELGEMRQHAEIGASMLAAYKDPTLQVASVIAKNHHERWDGGGYPSGLRASAIPLSARICALAEVYDAMTHDRAYRPAKTHEEAVAYIRSNKGKHFDPDLVDPFLNVLETYEARLAALGITGFEAAQESSIIESRNRLMRSLDRVQA